MSAISSESGFWGATTALRCVALFPVLYFLYWKTFLQTHHVYVDGFRLVRVCGVLNRAVDSRIISVVGAIALEQTPLQYLFGFYDLKFFRAPGNTPTKFISIPCLREQDALELQQYLCDQMSRRAMAVA